MPEFVNTVDLMGDELLTNCIIDHSIKEIADNAILHLGNCAFYECSNLTKADFPSATSVGRSAFYICTNLVTVNLPSVTSIGAWVFYKCTALASLILRAETTATLADVNAFGSSSVEAGTGYIYVPAALVSSYKAATNWKTYANQFRALEDYTVDGTITGALDETKI